MSGAAPLESGGDARGAARARARAKLTRLRRWAHVAIVPCLAAAVFAPSEPEPVLLGGVVVAVLVGVWLTRFASAPVRAALQGSRPLRALDLALWYFALMGLTLELCLIVASLFVSSPLLTPPNAKSRERVRDFRFGPYAPYLGGRANSRGFHDTDWVTPKPPGTFRIVALGDSFHFGIVPYAQNVLTLLEDELTRRCGRPIEVANMGVAGTAPIDYLFLLNDEGRHLEPDLVLTGIYVGNDIGVARSGSRLRPANWLTYAVADRLYQLARERWRKPAAAGLEGVKPVGNPMSPERYLERAVAEFLPTIRAASSASDDRRYADVFDVLARIGTLASGQHAVAIYPCEAQVDPDLLARACSAAGVSPGDHDPQGPGRRFLEHLRARGVPALDLLPALAARRAEGPAYEPNDSHWNARGNRIAAEALADWLEPIVRARLAR